MPVYDGLKIDPCIPDTLKEFTVTRKFRGDIYEIKVTNPNHVCKGVKSMTVDGKAVDGNVIPVIGDGNTHTVEVVMG